MTGTSIPGVPRFAVTGRRRRLETAWASEAGGPDPMWMIFDSRAHCGANLLGDQCKAVC